MLFVKQMRMVLIIVLLCTRRNEYNHLCTPKKIVSAKIIPILFFGWWLCFSNMCLANIPIFVLNLLLKKKKAVQQTKSRKSLLQVHAWVLEYLRQAYKGFSKDTGWVVNGWTVGHFQGKKGKNPLEPIFLLPFCGSLERDSCRVFVNNLVYRHGGWVDKIASSTVGRNYSGGHSKLVESVPSRCISAVCSLYPSSSSFCLFPFHVCAFFCSFAV